MCTEHAHHALHAAGHLFGQVFTNTGDCWVLGVSWQGMRVSPIEIQSAIPRLHRLHFIFSALAPALMTTMVATSTGFDVCLKAVRATKAKTMEGRKGKKHGLELL